MKTIMIHPDTEYEIRTSPNIPEGEVFVVDLNMLERVVTERLPLDGIALSEPLETED